MSQATTARGKLITGNSGNICNSQQALQDDIWSRRLDPYKARSRFANKLALRWLKLNEDNPNLLLMGFTYFADSPEVVAAVFKHLRRQGFAREYNEWEIQALLDKARDFNMSILPSVIKFARAWLRDNAEHRMASHAHAGMIHASVDKADIERAKQWFLSHKSEHSSFLVLNALMHQRRRAQKKPAQAESSWADMAWLLIIRGKRNALAQAM